MRAILWTYKVVGLCLLAAISGGCSGCNSNKGRLNGGGSTFVDPIMQKWSADYKQAKGVEIDYKKSGSGNGITQMTARTFDFGCTDAPMNKEQTEAAAKEGGEVVHAPLIMGAIVVVYNLPTVDKQLVLDGKTLAGIYTGQVKNWDHALIKALNPEVQLPNTPIIPVYRAEGSGTTKTFTEFLAKSDAAFAKDIGASSEPKWPKMERATGQQGNDGIAGFVKNKDNIGTIGYVEIYYAQKNDIKFAKIMNRKGTAISADAEGVVAAAAEAAMASAGKEPLHPLTYSLTDTDSDKAYPICGITYAVFYKKLPADKGKTIVDFLKWAVSDGQQYAKDLGYAPLPEDLRKKVQARLDELKFE